MGAYIAVVEHPYFDVTKKSGEFILKDVPPGNYTIEVWHETLGTQTQEIGFNAESDTSLKFTFKN